MIPEKEARLYLNASSLLPPQVQEDILRKMGSAANFFERQQEAELLVGKELYGHILKRVEMLNRQNTLATLRDQGVRLVLKEDPEYPASLHYVNCPPHLLYVRGRIEERSIRAVSIIGTRRPSMYGRGQAARFARSLADAGLMVVSGLARGIDSIAIKSCLEQGCPAIGVLGCGIDIVYPPENTNLFNQVAENGAVISEFPPGSKPLKPHFPWRNRLISGWGLGVLIIEAALRSGTLGTVRWALDQGKDVFALPGPVTNENSRACHQMIKDGAFLAEHPQDIIDHYAEVLSSKPLQKSAEKESEPEQENIKKVLGIGKEEISLEELIEINGSDYSQMTKRLNRAVAEGKIKRVPGAKYVLT